MIEFQPSTQAMRLCTVPGCGIAFTGRACPEHAYKRKGAQHWRKAYGNGWERARADYLLGTSMAQQWHYACCEDCLARGTRTRAVEVHHRLKIAMGGSRYDHRNLMALCVACHRIRTERGE